MPAIVLKIFNMVCCCSKLFPVVGYIRCSVDMKLKNWFAWGQQCNIWHVWRLSAFCHILDPPTPTCGYYPLVLSQFGQNFGHPPLKKRYFKVILAKFQIFWGNNFESVTGFGILLFYDPFHTSLWLFICHHNNLDPHRRINKKLRFFLRLHEIFFN